MKKLTSMADFYAKAKVDDRYKQAIRMAHTRCGCLMGSNTADTYEKAVEWAERWIADRRRNLVCANEEDTCMDMVFYINTIIDTMLVFQKKSNNLND